MRKTKTIYFNKLKLRIYKGKKYKDIIKCKKSAFIFAVQAEPTAGVTKYECTIHYAKGLINKFEAKNKKELMWKYKQFTNKSEVDYILNYWNRA